VRAQFRGVGTTLTSANEIFRGKKMIPPSLGGPKRVRVHSAQVLPSRNISRKTRNDRIIINRIINLLQDNLDENFFQNSIHSSYNFLEFLYKFQNFLEFLYNFIIF